MIIIDASLRYQRAIIKLIYRVVMGITLQLLQRTGSFYNFFFSCALALFFIADEMKMFSGSITRRHRTVAIAKCVNHKLHLQPYRTWIGAFNLLNLSSLFIRNIYEIYYIVYIRGTHISTALRSVVSCWNITR
jgi:hypothetical protein